MPYCKYCGRQVDPDGKYCVKCGRPVDPTESELPKITPSYEFKKSSSTNWGIIGAVIAAIVVIGSISVAVLWEQDTPQDSTESQQDNSDIQDSSDTSSGVAGGIRNPSTNFVEYNNSQPDYVLDSLGTPVNLMDNPSAVDPSWQELVDFLATDMTDMEIYIASFYMCGSFAEVVHNNAESAGIRTAWVAIDFAGGGVGHALNAFRTRDRGLVFVDSTGQPPISTIPRYDPNTGTYTTTDLTSNDKVAFIKIGEELGVIAIEYASSSYTSLIP